MKEGTNVKLAIDMNKIHVFDKETELNIFEMTDRMIKRRLAVCGGAFFTHGNAAHIVPVVGAYSSDRPIACLAMIFQTGIGYDGNRNGRTARKKERDTVAKSVKVSELVQAIPAGGGGGRRGLSRRITVDDLYRPGLEMAGYFKYYPKERVQILGRTELAFFETLTPESTAGTDETGSAQTRRRASSSPAGWMCRKN